MAANVDCGCRDFPRRRGIVVIRNTQGAIAVPQEAKNPRLVPAWIAEFKSIGPFSSEQLEKPGKPLIIDGKLWRKLKQDRTDFGLQSLEPSFHQFQTIAAFVREAFPMSDEFRCFPGKNEFVRRRLSPGLDRFERRRSVQ